MKRLLLILLFITTSCDYTKDREIVMDSDGVFYELRASAGNESYQLDPIDTTKFEVKGFKPIKN